MDSAKSVSLALVPTATRIMVYALGAIVGLPALGNFGDKFQEYIADSAEKLGEKAVEERIEELEEVKKSTEHLKVALREYVENLDAPLVIVIDELDRCVPVFAVKLLERIKHYFEIKNIFFVISTHKTQLQNSIQGVYGTTINAEEYLKKFIHLTIQLPKETFSARQKKLGAHSVVMPFLKVFFGSNDDGLELSQKVSVFIGILAESFNMSLRDIKRAMVFATFYEQSDLPLQISVNIYMSCVRVANPDLYLEFLQNLKNGCDKTLRKFSHNERIKKDALGIFLIILCKKICDQSLDRDELMKTQFTPAFLLHDPGNYFVNTLKALDLAY